MRKYEMHYLFLMHLGNLFSIFGAADPFSLKPFLESCIAME
jgi:hypothetical protein